MNALEDATYDHHERCTGEADNVVLKNRFFSKPISTISFGQGLGCRNGEAEMRGTQRELQETMRSDHLQTRKDYSILFFFS